MTTKRKDAPAAAQDYHCSELCDSVFMPSVKLVVDAGEEQPTVALDLHRDVHRYLSAAERLAGGGTVLVQAEDAKMRSLVHQKERQRTTRHLPVDGSALAKTLELTEKAHASLVERLALLPADAKRDLTHELRVLRNERDVAERGMATHRQGSPGWLALLPAHRELVLREVEVERLRDAAEPLRRELASKVRDAAEAARNACATSLAMHIRSALVKRRDAILAADAELYRNYPRAIPASIESVWAEARRIGGMARRLRGDDAKGPGAEWEFFFGLDSEMDVNLQLRLGVMKPTPVDSQNARRAAPAEPEIVIGHAD